MTMNVMPGPLLCASFTRRAIAVYFPQSHGLTRKRDLVADLQLKQDPMSKACVQAEGSSTSAIFAGTFCASHELATRNTGCARPALEIQS